MRLLIVKTSSLGDIIHTLPALTDIAHHRPTILCDWVVEENFVEVPRWHPLVNRIIPVALRRWRKRPWEMLSEWKCFKRALISPYDWIVDAQGLLKSAFLSFQATGQRHGLDKASVREPLASLLYQHQYAISKDQHAVNRIRQLFAQIFQYESLYDLPDYGIASHFSIRPQATVIFLHSTTWQTKHWPESYWIALAKPILKAGYTIKLPWYTEQEYARAKRIATSHPQGITLLPKTNLQGMATELAQAQAVVSVDTGLAHLTAALAIPTITLYSATQPAWTGTYGQKQWHMQADFPCAPCLRKRCPYTSHLHEYPPCYQSLTATTVWKTLKPLL